MLDLIEVELWFKSSISGIIILGAIGSLLALAVTKLISPFVLKLLRIPRDFYVRIMTKRYYKNGFVAGVISQDETGTKIIWYVIYHLARLILAAWLALVSMLIFIGIAIIQEEIILNYGLFVSSSLFFISLYLMKAEYDNLAIIYMAEWPGSGLSPKYTSGLENVE